MRGTFGLVMVAGLTGLAAAAPPPPGTAAPPAGQPVPWANKFFLPDIAANRDQTPPPVIVHNFGDVPHGTLCVHKFLVTNIYDVPIQITEVRKSCHCLDYVPMTRVLQPNESAELTVTMNSGKFVGYNAQKFYVTFGPKYVSTAVIEMRATSRTDVSVTPGAVEFATVSKGVKANQSVIVRYAGKSRDWKITEVVPPQGPFEVQVHEVGRGGPLRGGAEYRVDVTLKPTATPGLLTEQITLKTNDPGQPLLHVTVKGVVIAPLVVSPVHFDGVPVGETSAQRVTIRAARSFRVVAVDGAGDGVTVEPPPPSVSLPVQGLTVRFTPGHAGQVVRELRVRTDLDGGAEATIHVQAEGIAK
jgi:hypothetical protein